MVFGGCHIQLCKVNLPRQIARLLYRTIDSRNICRGHRGQNIRCDGWLCSLNRNTDCSRRESGGVGRHVITLASSSSMLSLPDSTCRLNLSRKSSGCATVLLSLGSVSLKFFASLLLFYSRFRVEVGWSGTIMIWYSISNTRIGAKCCLLDQFGCWFETIPRAKLGVVSKQVKVGCWYRYVVIRWSPERDRKHILFSTVGYTYGDRFLACIQPVVSYEIELLISLLNWLWRVLIVIACVKWWGDAVAAPCFLLGCMCLERSHRYVVWHVGGNADVSGYNENLFPFESPFWRRDCDVCPYSHRNLMKRINNENK